MIKSFDIDWWPKRVIAGAGAVAQLGSAMDSLGRHRAVILCGNSVANGEAIKLVRAALGDRLVGEFHEVEMHAPLPMLERAAAYMKAMGADVLVSVGGGSAIDSGKGTCLIATVGRDYEAYALKPGGARSLADNVPPLSLAHIAIPTTAGSGSEVAPTCGLRDPAAGHKRIFRNERLIPDIAILDPAMAVEAPERLTACSGMTAVARCVESLYGARRHPIRSALALHGLRMLVRSLPVTIKTPGDQDARFEAQIGSSMSAIAANVNTSAVHAIGHVVGGKYGLQHGIAHAILLSSCMRRMLHLSGGDQNLLLDALGGNGAGKDPDAAGAEAADRMRDFVAQLPMPQRLRDVGVLEVDIADIADHASHDAILVNSGASWTAESIADLLRSAW